MLFLSVADYIDDSLLSDLSNDFFSDFWSLNCLCPSLHHLADHQHQATGHADEWQRHEDRRGQRWAFRILFPNVSSQERTLFPLELCFGKWKHRTIREMFCHLRSLVSKCLIVLFDNNCMQSESQRWVLCTLWFWKCLFLLEMQRQREIHYHSASLAIELHLHVLLEDHKRLEIQMYFEVPSFNSFDGRCLWPDSNVWFVNL